MQSNNSLGVVAVVPFFSQSDNVNADSCYVYLRNVVPELARQSPGTQFIIFFPDPKYGRDRWTYKPDAFENDQIHFVAWPYDTAQLSSVLGFHPVRFSQIEEIYGPTMYWLQQVEMGPFMYRGYHKHFAQINMPALIAQHHYIIHKSLPYPIDQQFARRWLQTGGSLAADRVIYNSKHAANMASESFSDLLSAVQLEKLAQKSIVLPFGLLSGAEPAAPTKDNLMPPVFVFNHRFEGYKQADLTFEQFARLRESGHKFSVWATQTAGQKTRAGIDKSVYAPDRADYLRNIAVPAINTMNSVHETFCISILDSLALGHLVVLPNAVTFPELVPPGYPYLFSDINDQYQMLDMILTHWPADYLQWHDRLIAHAREHFNLSAYAAQYLDIMSAVEMGYRDHESKAHTSVALQRLFDTVTPGNSLSPQDLQRALARTSDQTTGKQAFSGRRMVRECLKSGQFKLIYLAGGMRLQKC